MRSSFFFRSVFKVFLFFLFFITPAEKGFSQDVTFIKATSQRWTAGIRGGGGGINYEIHLRVNLPSSKMKFLRIWIGDKSYSLNYVMRKSQVNFTGKNTQDFSKNDTVVLKFSRFERGIQIPEDKIGNADQPNDSIQPKLPYAFKGDGLISYSKGKKKKYFVIAKFEELPRLNYP